jgi:DNA processing protein
MTSRSPGLVLSEAQRLDWLRLIRSESVGPRTFRTLINRFGSASEALVGLPDLARRAGKTVRICSKAEAERELAQATRAGVRFIALGEDAYPRALQAIDGPPPLLAVKGDVGLLARPAVSIVGSRNASAAGLRFTELIARGLGDAGLVVVSGLARGIDARAHEGALVNGTIAVLAGGHLKIYPSEHEDLCERIASQGLVVSEMPLLWEPRARDFPRRNRLVSGLALGVVIVEAARRSGSLITARFALEQGREVFAAPGSPLDPRAEGTNDLIRQGATLITRADDILSVLAPLIESGPPIQSVEDNVADPGDEEPLWDELDVFEEGDAGAPLGVPALAERASGDAREVVLALLGPSPVPLDEIVRSAALPAGTVRSILVELELAGRLTRHAGGLISLT